MNSQLFMLTAKSVAIRNRRILFSLFFKIINFVCSLKCAIVHFMHLQNQNIYSAYVKHKVSKKTSTSLVIPAQGHFFKHFVPERNRAFSYKAKMSPAQSRTHC